MTLQTLPMTAATYPDIWLPDSLPIPPGLIVAW